ncbi:ECF-type sigma factor [Fodinibius halophilus]|uniref:Sigma-70 family RNA polymerase sigma factor n=1 Tax=Fodinibius halophilus TaxID=1736908 RepID=A0A6M1T9H7_9BACT|nr:ECF-type sigma factor [Fodinibius halophilus]NGP87002.1 sigma-70 family RNA polymerase sigma factor [Fodinibius halophilus]
MALDEEHAKISHLIDNLPDSSQKTYNELFPLLYEELKKRAYSQLKPERNIHLGITNTDLVHEVYLKMLKQKGLKCQNCNHFLAIASNCMRQILIDYARKQHADKRGGNNMRVPFHEELIPTEEPQKRSAFIDKKIDELEKYDNRLSEVVIMRFFNNMTMQSIANVLKLSERTVKRDWKRAKNWLYNKLSN